MEQFNNAKPLKAISKVRAYEKALLEMRGRMDGRIKSLKTAWPKFNDATLNGLKWNTLTVVGARPGVGKTLFMEQLVTEVIALNQDQDFQVLQFQFEMPEKSLGMRAFSAITQKNYGILHSKYQALDEDIYNKCRQYTSTLNKNNRVFSIYKPCTVSNIEKHREEFKHVSNNRLFTDGTSRIYPKCQLCFNEENKKWRTKNKTLYLKTRSQEGYKRSDNITDSYCIRRIKQGNYEMLKGVTIPPELIDLQRVLLLLPRRIQLIFRFFELKVVLIYPCDGYI